MRGRTVKGYYLDRGVNARVRQLSHPMTEALIRAAGLGRGNSGSGCDLRLSLIYAARLYSLIRPLRTPSRFNRTLSSLAPIFTKRIGPQSGQSY